MTRAEIIAIGSEILLGEIVDTNTSQIARALRGLGVDLYRTVAVGDNVERIAEAVVEALQRAEIVITTGGLGPTVDDPTRAAVARAMGVESEFRAELWEQIVARVAKYGRTPTENQKRQAYVPKGAIAIENPVGTAPAFIVELPSRDAARRGEEVRAIISLPGVPKEMEYLLHHAVIPYLQRRYDLREVLKIRLLHAAGAGEAMIDEQIGDLETLANPTVGLAAHSGIVDIRITAKAASEAEAGRLINEVEEQIRGRLGELIFGADDDALEEVALRLVGERGWRLLVLESGLDGALSRRLASRGHPALLSVEGVSLEKGQLMSAVRAGLAAHTASAALGAAAFVAPEQVVELALVSPQGEQQRRLTYGGHAANLPRWAANMALDWLRRAAQTSANPWPEGSIGQTED